MSNAHLTQCNAATAALAGRIPRAGSEPPQTINDEDPAGSASPMYSFHDGNSSISSPISPDSELGQPYDPASPEWDAADSGEHAVILSCPQPFTWCSRCNQHLDVDLIWQTLQHTATGSSSKWQYAGPSASKLLPTKKRKKEHGPKPVGNVTVQSWTVLFPWLWLLGEIEDGKHKGHHKVGCTICRDHGGKGAFAKGTALARDANPMSEHNKTQGHQQCVWTSKGAAALQTGAKRTQEVCNKTADHFILHIRSLLWPEAVT